MLIYAIYDKKAMVFFPPFTVENKVMAIRGTEETVNTSGTVISRYPEDFALYFLGEFDEKTGKVTQPDMNILECECMQLLRPQLKQRMFNSAAEDVEAPRGAGAE